LPRFVDDDVEAVGERAFVESDGVRGHCVRSYWKQRARAEGLTDGRGADYSWQIDTETESHFLLEYT
jgi:hypothetical protein